MKRYCGRLVAAFLACFLLFAADAMAAWTYMITETGEPVWVNDESGEIVKAGPGISSPNEGTSETETGVAVPDSGASGPESEAAGSVVPEQENGAAAAGNIASGQESGAAAADSSIIPEQESGAAAVDGGTSGENGETAVAVDNPYLIFSNGRYIDISKPMVALTYDDGPKAKNGNRIMDILEQYNGRATFFLVGNMVASNKAEVQRMVNDGMEVANHSWDHKYFNKLGAEEIRKEVAMCNSAIQEACGVTPALIRLPGGNITDTVRANVSMPMIYWTIDTRDWEHRNAAKTVDSVLSKVKDGDIVLMHEIWDATVTAQETLIPMLYSRGFQLVTVSELVKFRGYTLGTGVQYKSFPIH